MGRTVAIIDFAHSGTTMLAGICQILGVPMVGEQHKVRKWEDLEVMAALKDEAQFAALVKERNAEHNTWGFKCAGAWKYPASLVHLRDPVYLAIYKDPVSVTWRRFGKGRVRPTQRVRNTIDQMKASIDGICFWGQAVHTLSYHRAITKPGVFVQEIASLIDWAGDDEQLNRATAYIQPNLGRPRQPYPEVESWI
jgi:hypothetical protein